MTIKYPDYDNSILSIATSVLKHYGAPSIHTSLCQLDEFLANNYKNVVVMLFDGMGTAILEKHLPKQSFFRKNQKAVISSVFPPTTTAATMSIQTGLAPIEHGWLGWSLYFSELDANVSIFPNTLSGSKGIPAADYHVARRFIPHIDIFNKIADSTKGEVKALSVSPFSPYCCQSSKDLCNTVKGLCEEKGRKYIYTYWHQPDFDMHDYGVKHKIITAHIQQFNDEVEDMCSVLSDTLVIVTADHGMVDTNWRFIPDYPEIEECLLRKPSIESRASTFFIKDGYDRQFRRAFKKVFKDKYLLMSKREILDSELFGSGKPNPRSLGFIGDYIAIATGNISIECNPSSEHDLFKAAHAGITADEMEVPFIAIACTAPLCTSY